MKHLVKVLPHPIIGEPSIWASLSMRFCCLLPFLIFCFWACHVAIAQEKLPHEVELLLREYRVDLAKAKQGSDKILEAEGSKIAAKLLRESRADEAEVVAEQIKQKMAGTSPPVAHKDMLSLLVSYDKAVLSAKKAVRERYLGRAGSMMRVFEGKDIQAVVALAEIQREVTLDGPGLVGSNTVDSKESVAGRYVFQAAGRSFKRELMVDGTVNAEIPGKWTVKGKKLRIEYNNGAWVEFALPSVDGKLTGKTNKDEVLVAQKVIP